MQEIYTYWMTHTWLLVMALIAGFFLLVKGADWLVDGASALARRLGVSDLVIGLTVVAFGTSMPEFVVNMISAADGSTDLAITNVLGSNIINIFVALGLTALVFPVVSQKRSRDFDIPMSIIAAVLVFAAVVVPSSVRDLPRCISRWEGIGLLCIFIVFLISTFRNANDRNKASENKAEKSISMSVFTSLLLILVGIGGLALGGELIVKSAVQMATDWGVSQTVIGLTIVALGTSLPEIATSVMAAWKKNSDLAIGNVIGSNIFNIFLVLGTSAVIRPLPAYKGFELDAWCAALGSILVWLFLKTNREREIKRWEGLVLLLVYSAYLTYRLLYI